MAVVHNLLPTTGESVSRLGFGCMRLPTGTNGRIDREETAEMFRLALEAGVNYFDTAYMYHGGESEEVVGELLGKYERSRYTVTSKLPLPNIKTFADAKSIFATQKKRLGLERIDHYLLHGVNAHSWPMVKELGLIDYLQELKARGDIGSIGFSFHDEYALFEEILRTAPWDLCQIQYNYMDEDTQAGTKGYELTKELGVPMVVMESVRGGALAKLSDDLESEFRAINPDASMASWALRWVAGHENVKVALSGMSNVAQVRDNIATFTDLKPLNERESAAIAHAVEVMKNRRGNGCTGCRYCAPCPNGVDIAGVFQAWNQYYRFHSFNVVSGAWNRFIRPDAKPDNCVECGQCEEKCPQHLDIREDLKKAQKELDNPAW